MIRYFLATIIVLLMSVTVTARFDITTLITESLLATDLWQTEEGHWATPSNPRILANGVRIYETNPLVAGSDMANYKNAAVAWLAILDKLPNALVWTYIVLQAKNVSSNNQLLHEAELGKRWMLAYRISW